MISFPNCKINLGLRILEKREDGFHNLESVFFPVKWYDALEIIPAEKFSFEVWGKGVERHLGENICVTAYNLLKQEFDLPPVKIFLLKNIPAGGGLGGGSADGVFTLKMLNKIFRLKLSEEQLIDYSTKLGSDCAFFVHNRPQLAKGRGESLTAISINLTGLYLMLVYPEFSIQTEMAYSALDSVRKTRSLPENEKHTDLLRIIKLPVKKWRKMLCNDFEEIVFGMHKDLQAIKKRLYDFGAVYASLSGSGSVVYGLFEKEPEKMFVEGNYHTVVSRL